MSDHPCQPDKERWESYSALSQGKRLGKAGLQDSCGNSNILAENSVGQALDQQLSMTWLKRTCLRRAGALFTVPGIYSIHSNVPHCWQPIASVQIYYFPVISNFGTRGERPLLRGLPSYYIPCFKKNHRKYFNSALKGSLLMLLCEYSQFKCMLDLLFSLNFGSNLDF